MTDAQIYTFHDPEHTFNGAVENGVAMETEVTKRSRVVVESSDSAMNAREDVNSCIVRGQGKGAVKHSRSPDFGRLMHEDSYTSDAESDAVVKKMG